MPRLSFLRNEVLLFLLSFRGYKCSHDGGADLFNTFAELVDKAFADLVFFGNLLLAQLTYTPVNQDGLSHRLVNRFDSHLVNDLPMNDRLKLFIAQIFH